MEHKSGVANGCAPALTYNKPGENEQVATVLARGRFEGHALTDVHDIFTANSLLENANGYNSRIAFGRDGTIYVSNGDSDSDAAQDPNSHRGKIMRLRDHGSVPPDNPFVGRARYRPEIYSLGHRNTLGPIVNPVNGELWNNENGPDGGDEINVILPGKNYGWPVVSYGRWYEGPRVSEVPWKEDCDIRNGRMHRRPLPGWKNNVFVAACARVKLPAPATWSGSCSTRNGKRCAVKACSRNCTSESATSAKVRTGCSIY